MHEARLRRNDQGRTTSLHPATRDDLEAIEAFFARRSPDSEAVIFPPAKTEEEWHQQMDTLRPMFEQKQDCATEFSTSLNNLAALYREMGFYSEAEPLYLHALDIQSRTLPDDHPWNKTGWNNFRGMVQAALEAGQADQLSDHPTTQTVLQQLRETVDSE